MRTNPLSGTHLCFVCYLLFFCTRFFYAKRVERRRKNIRYVLTTILAFLGIGVILAYQNKSFDFRSRAETSPSSIILSYNNQLLSAVREASPDRSKIISIALARKVELLKDMRSNPQRFLVSLLTPDQRKLMPSYLYDRGLIEKDETMTGTLELIHGDPRSGTSTLTTALFTTRQNNRPIRFTADFISKPRFGRNPLRVSTGGVSVGKEYLVTTQSNTTTAVGQSPLTPRGNIKTLVIRYTFEGSGLTSNITKDAMNANIFSTSGLTVRNYLYDMSRSQFSMSGDITDKWYTIPAPPTTNSNCISDITTWMDMAYQAADADYDMSQYQAFIYFNPTIPGCGYLGAPGGNFGSDSIWINGYNDTWGYIHELGHAFSFAHSGSMVCNGKSIDEYSKCSFGDRVDNYDPMGFGHTAHFNTAYKNFLGWIPDTEITNVTTSNVYSIQPMELTGNAPKAIAMNAPSDPKDPNTPNKYFFEYRTKANYDADISEEGVQVRLFGNSDWSPFTVLIDGSPNDGNIVRPAIPPGKSVFDEKQKVSVDVLSQTADSAKLLALMPDSEPADSPPAPGADSWLIRVQPAGCAASATTPVQAFYTFWSISDPNARGLQLQTDILATGTHNVYINRIPDTSAESYPTLPFYAGARTGSGETLPPVAIIHPEYFHSTSPYVPGSTSWFAEFWGVKWFNQDNGDFQGLPTGTYTVKYFTSSACNYPLTSSKQELLSVSSQFTASGSLSSSGMLRAIRVYDQTGKPAAVSGMRACDDKGQCTSLDSGSANTTLIPLGSGQPYTSGSWATITLNMPANSQYSKIAKRFCSSTSYCQFPSDTKQIKVKLENRKEVVYGWVLNSASASGVDNTTVSWLRNGPCNGKSTGQCNLDTRSMFMVNGKQVESVTAYGKGWNWDIGSDGTRTVWSGNGFDLTTVTRYRNGPCNGIAAGSCRFDTRTQFSIGTQLIESITAYGKIWNYDASGNLLQSGNLSSNTFAQWLTNGPCAGKSTCILDSRSYFFLNGRKVESVTAYGKGWNWDIGSDGSRTAWSGNGFNLTTVDRYNAGPCVGKSTCTFSTRSQFTIGGVPKESVTAYGKLWDW